MILCLDVQTILNPGKPKILTLGKSELVKKYLGRQAYDLRANYYLLCCLVTFPWFCVFRYFPQS